MAEVSARARPSPDVVRTATSFVGREAELRTARTLLADSRLLTLTGAGGIGKTRLALEVTAEMTERYRDGVWNVELGGLRPGDDVAETIFSALGMTTQTSGDAVGQLVDELAASQLLLVLDNCEHLLADVRGVVDALLRSTAEVSVLATSREPLGIGGERVLGISPLRVPARVVDVDDARSYPAVRLLEDRAVAASHAFALDEHNLSDVVAVVSRLDGLPLAIELAAVRLRSLSAGDLLQRLGDRFTMLNRGNEMALPQHRTLRAMVEWSLDLCTPSERELWARMSVFAGSADLEAVLAVCDHDVSVGTLLDDLDSLVAKSVVTVETVDGVTRYRLLETLAELGREQLAAAGETDLIHGRHAEHYRSTVRAFPDRFWSPDQQAAVRRITVERQNLAQAFEHLLSGRTDDGQAALEMAADLRGYWLALSHLREGRRWLDAALAGTPAPTPARGHALMAAMWVSILQNDADAVDSRLEEIATFVDSLGDPSLEYRHTMWLGVLAVLGGDTTAGVDALERCAVWFNAAGDLEGSSVSFWMLTIGLAIDGRGDDARAVAERGMRIGVDVGGWGQSYVMWGSAHAAWARGDHAEAMSVARRALRIKYDYGDSYGIALVLGVLSGACLDSGDPVRAATLLGIAAVAFGTLGTGYASLGPGLGATYQDVDDRTREALGADAYTAAHDLGRGMKTAEARAFVLERPSKPSAVAAPVAPVSAERAYDGADSDGLSPREVEVASLVARGLSNRAVAERLVLSHRTVEGHVERILAKLGFRNRVELAAWVVARSENAPRGADSPGMG